MKLVSLANRCDVAVAAGAQHPLFQKLVTAEFWHGKNGLATSISLCQQMTNSIRAEAPDLIIEMVHANPRTRTRRPPSGRFTNIALASWEKIPPSPPLVQGSGHHGRRLSPGGNNGARGVQYL